VRLQARTKDSPNAARNNLLLAEVKPFVERYAKQCGARSSA
jgi:hypothetical protein